MRQPTFMRGQSPHTHHLTWYGMLYFRFWHLHKGHAPSRWWTKACRDAECDQT